MSFAKFGYLQCSITAIERVFFIFREVQEECGLTVLEDEIDYMGIIDFEFKGDPVHMEVHVFLARRFQGYL
jgi:hypothetical protein